MNGQQLHARYRQALLERGCESDEWDALDDVDRAAWDDVADQLDHDFPGEE